MYKLTIHTHTQIMSIKCIHHLGMFDAYINFAEKKKKKTLFSWVKKNCIQIALDKLLSWLKNKYILYLLINYMEDKFLVTIQIKTKLKWILINLFFY